MNNANTSKPNRVAKGYFIVTLLAGGATCAWALAHSFAFSSVRSAELIALLALGITAGVASFLTYKVHTIVGAEIINRVGFPYPVVPIIRHHHERWDGRGYPDGLRQEQIPITARIMSVIDCFDSAREDRPFRQGMTRDEAVDLLHT